MSTPDAPNNTPYYIMKEQRYRIASLWLLLLVMMQAAAQQPAAIMADSDSLTADTAATTQPPGKELQTSSTHCGKADML